MASLKKARDNFDASFCNKESAIGRVTRTRAYLTFLRSEFNKYKDEIVQLKSYHKHLCENVQNNYEWYLNESSTTVNRISFCRNVINSIQAEIVKSKNLLREAEHTLSKYALEYQKAYNDYSNAAFEHFEKQGIWKDN